MKNLQISVLIMEGLQIGIPGHKMYKKSQFKLMFLKECIKKMYHNFKKKIIILQNFIYFC